MYICVLVFAYVCVLLNLFEITKRISCKTYKSYHYQIPPLQMIVMFLKRDKSKINRPLTFDSVFRKYFLASRCFYNT